MLKFREINVSRYSGVLLKVLTPIDGKSNWILSLVFPKYQDKNFKKIYVQSSNIRYGRSKPFIAPCAHGPWNFKFCTIWTKSFLRLYYTLAVATLCSAPTRNSELGISSYGKLYKNWCLDFPYCIYSTY